MTRNARRPTLAGLVELANSDWSVARLRASGTRWQTRLMSAFFIGWPDRPDPHPFEIVSVQTEQLKVDQEAYDREKKSYLEQKVKRRATAYALNQSASRRARGRSPACAGRSAGAREM